MHTTVAEPIFNFADEDGKDPDDVDHSHRQIRVRRQEKSIFDGEVVLINADGKEIRSESTVSLSSTIGPVMIVSVDY